MTASSYVLMLRPHRWTKNLFVLFGAVLAAQVNGVSVNAYGYPLLLGVVSVCFLSSANYLINEWMDLESDQYYPLKSLSPESHYSVNVTIIFVGYIIFLTVGLSLASLLSDSFHLAAAVFLATGLLYNVKPFRLKDCAYADILCDAFTSPLRIVMGWFLIMPQKTAPLSLLLGFWMAACFYMAIKRYAEFKLIGASENLYHYRRSFRKYSKDTLLIFSFCFSLFSILMFSFYSFKYQKELFFLLPFLIVLYGWYMKIAIKIETRDINPDLLFREKGYLLYCIVFIGITWASLWMR